eukprot:9311018-Alexandrium_andersonii.AAC.1
MAATARGDRIKFNVPGGRRAHHAHATLGATAHERTQHLRVLSLGICSMHVRHVRKAALASVGKG